MIRFRLYIAGQSAKDELIVDNVTQILKDEYGTGYQLEVIDVIEHPELATRDSILATPTLVKYDPHPVRRIIGDFSNKTKVLAGLDLLTQT
ncbi:MAG: circadian clock protein KaiB [candidate division WOR-3 bacterium]|nr:MAG: circadian clock protein KaiB [candidate division WOR-3 bacterium]